MPEDISKQLEYMDLANHAAKNMEPDQYQQIMATLLANEDKDFVQRVLNPGDYPKVANPDGSYSSHRMGSAEVEGKYIAFPTLFHDKAKGKLYEAKDPVKEALKRKDYIEFNTPEEAEIFANNGYKIGMNAKGPYAPKSLLNSLFSTLRK